MRRSIVASVVVTGVVALPLLPVPSAAAAPYRGANTAAVQDDFNGDGYRDLAVGAPDATNGSVEAGSVVVLYGSANAVSTTHRGVFSQASTGVPGDPEDGDSFGAAVASADLDRDGYADLLVGAPGEDVGSVKERGSVTVLWGGPNGLTGGANISPPTGYGAGQTYCGFGLALATGDMNSDGALEVSVSSRCDGAAYSGPFTRTGQPASRYDEQRLGAPRGVVMGDVNGDGQAERFWLSGPADDDLRGPVFIDKGPEIPIDPQANQPSELPYADGYTGQIGDVNGDGYGDLITGISNDDYLAGASGAAHRGGEVQVLYGSAQGITADQHPQVFHQDTAGIPGSGEDGDQFGRALSVADIDADGYADVLIGVPGEAIGSLESAGSVLVLHGSATGLTTTGATGYSQDTAGVPGSAEAGDFLGEAVHLADLNKDGKADLVVGASGENTDGCVWVAHGSTAGFDLTGSANLCGKSSGITVGDVDGRFGAALTSPNTTF